MNPIVFDVLKSMLRHGCSGVAVWMVSKGFLEADKVGGFAEVAVNVLLSAALVAFPVLWSVFRAHVNRLIITEAAEAPAGVKPAEPPKWL